MKHRHKEETLKGYESPYIETKTVWADGTVDIEIQLFKQQERADVSTSTSLRIPLRLDVDDLACVARTMVRLVKHSQRKAAERHDVALTSVREEL